MPRVAGTDVLKINVRGAGAAAASLDRLARGLADEMNAELRYLGIAITEIYRDAAPKDTGDLGDALRAVPFFRTIRPSLRVVVEPLHGHDGEGRDSYDYLGVTRRGHRKAQVMSSRPGGAMRVHTEGHRNPHIYIYRRAVQGYRPTSDWVSRAEPLVDRELDGSAERLGRRIERRLL